MTKRVVKEIISWIMVIVVAFLLAFVINRFVIFQVEVPSGSMETTIMTGDRVATLRLSYLFSDPKRGDIVVFLFPDDEKVDYIKRIIGVPGDTIEIKEGVLYINEEPYEENYLKDPMVKEDFGPISVPEESYFMMGDNRNTSADARVWKHKFVHADKIKGKAIFKYPDFSWLN